MKSYDLSSRLILLVEEDPFLLLNTRLALQDAGASVIVSQQASLAEEIARESSLDGAVVALALAGNVHHLLAALQQMRVPVITYHGDNITSPAARFVLPARLHPHYIADEMTVILQRKR